jgi:hypothetical protein
MNFLKINEQCLKNIKDVTDALSAIETKGDSTMIMYKIRLMLMSTLEQIQKDNQEDVREEKIEIDNTKKKEVK